jgi:class 3 adenylate cyclase
MELVEAIKKGSGKVVQANQRHDYDTDGLLMPDIAVVLPRWTHSRPTHSISPTHAGGSVAEKRVQRRLAAILAADVVGYSRMMG